MKPTRSTTPKRRPRGAPELDDSRMTTFTFRKPSALPGFGLTLGITVAYLSLVVLIPLAATFAKTATLDWATFVRAVTSPRVLASYRLTFTAALGGALINAVFGFLVAWVLVRYTFPVKRVVDAARRSAVCVADCRGWHRARRGVCAEWLDRPVSRAARHQGGVHAARACSWR